MVEPGQRSLQTARAVKRLNPELGITPCYGAGFKTKSETNCQFIKDNLFGFHILGSVDHNEEIAQADTHGMNVYKAVPQVAQKVRNIKDELEKLPPEV